MKRRHSLALLLLFAFRASAQDPATGFPPYGSFEDGRFDAINRQNLNVNFAIPIVSVPGRGMGFSFALYYDSLIWKHGSNWAPTPLDKLGNPTWGWKLDKPVGEVAFKTQTSPCIPQGGSNTRFYDFSYTEPNGTKHSFTIEFWINSNNCGPVGGAKTGYATDQSGYYIDATAMTSGPGSPAYVYNPAGLRVSTANSFTDTNGNFVSLMVSGSTWTWKDTMGRDVLRITRKTGTPNCMDGPIGYPECIEYEYRDTADQPQVTKLFLKSYNVRTNFACTGVNEYNQSGKLLPEKVKLPNGQAYTFIYEGTPSFLGYTTARVRRVTLPTGGFYEYTYPAPNNGMNCADSMVKTLIRTISSGEMSPPQWTFARTPVGSDWKTKLTPPILSYHTVARESTYTFNSSGKLISIKLYDGIESPLVLRRTVNVTWTGQTPSSQTVIQETKHSKRDTSFDSFGNLTQLVEYDWGDGAPGSPIRTTEVTYLATTDYVSRNIRNRPTQTLVRAGGTGGIIESRTVIDYDQNGYINTPCPTGAAQHDDLNYGAGFVYRGLPTTVTTYQDAAAATGAFPRHTYFDCLGNVRKTDVNGTVQNELSFSATTQYAYPDSITAGPSGGPQLTSSATYNFPTGLAVTGTNPNNQTTTFGYDIHKRLTSVSRPGPSGTTIVLTHLYNDSAKTITSTYPVDASNAITRVSSFDQLGRLFLQSSSAPEGEVHIGAMFDTWGRPFRTSNPYRSGDTKFWTETRVDALGRTVAVHKVEDGNWNIVAGNTTTYAHAGNSVTVTDPTGKQQKSETDGLGRLVKLYEPDVNAGGTLTQLTSYQYTILDLLTQVSQGVQTRTYAYDDFGRLTSEATPEAGTWGYQYDSLGRLSQRTDARNVIATYSYDTLNRSVSVSFNVGGTGVPTTDSVTYEYGTDPAQNNKGRLKKVTKGSGTTEIKEEFTYNLLGRVTQVVKTIGGVAYTTAYDHNPAGELTSITYPSGRVVTQSYDAAGRLTTLSSGGTNYLSGLAYNAAGQATRFLHGNGVCGSFAFTPERLQLQSLVYFVPSQSGDCQSTASQTLLSLAYGYTQSGGNNGQITSISDNTGTAEAGRNVTYTYDALHRLKTALTAGSSQYPQWGLQWFYDRYGNRDEQAQTHGSPPTHNPEIDPNTNRILGYCYDANGNLLAESSSPCPVQTYAYDAANRLISYSSGGGAGVYVHDGAGLRVKKCVPNCTSPTNTTVYIFSGTTVIAEYDNGAAVSWPAREYIYGGSTVLAKIEAGTPTYYHYDHLSLRLTTNSGGAVLSQQGHYPFGDSLLWYLTGPQNKMTFTTYERDSESANDYAVFRSHINRFGRFSSPDTLQGSIADPQSLNRYTYALNDPCNLTDPLGLQPCTLTISSNQAFTAGAESVIKDIFEKAGVGVTFVEGRGGDFDVEQFSRAPGGSAFAFGYAILDTNLVEVNNAQIRVSAGLRGKNYDHALGAITAHEIGHAVLQTGEHSIVGLMRRGDLAARDVFGGLVGTPILDFTEAEARKIQERCRELHPQRAPQPGGAGVGGSGRGPGLPGFQFSTSFFSITFYGERSGDPFFFTISGSFTSFLGSVGGNWHVAAASIGAYSPWWIPKF